MDAFKGPKELILSSPCLVHYNVTLDTVFTCDASPYRVGCILSQTDKKGEERLVAFYFRSFNQTERRYALTDREGLSVTVEVKKV